MIDIMIVVISMLDIRIWVGRKHTAVIVVSFFPRSKKHSFTWNFIIKKFKILNSTNGKCLLFPQTGYGPAFPAFPICAAIFVHWHNKRASVFVLCDFNRINRYRMELMSIFIYLHFICDTSTPAALYNCIRNWVRIW